MLVAFWNGQLLMTTSNFNSAVPTVTACPLTVIVWVVLYALTINTTEPARKTLLYEKLNNLSTDGVAEGRVEFRNILAWFL